jgi:intracellular septation protein
MPLLKLALELGPLAVLFIASNRFDFKIATAAFMVATIISLIASRLTLKKIPVMPLVTGVVVMIFGTLTIVLADDTFIKLKPTIVNVLFALTLAGGLVFQRLLLKIVLGEVIKLQDEGWRKLTIRWIGFFFFLAVLNEIIWRNFSFQFWTGFKLFGVMPLTMIFMMAQIGLLQKYQIPEDMADAPSR